MSKLLEQHIHQAITTHLNDIRPLSNKQWGFQPGKSTVTALLAVTHDWLKALESRYYVCSVFLDLRKAFNSVPHRLLLEKLNTYALDSHILSWLHSYTLLKENNMWLSAVIHFLIHLCFQEFRRAPFWVHYYSSFILMMCRLSSCMSENTVLNLYADDMLLYKQIKCSEDYQQLQLDIDKISSWVGNNHLSLNPAKCKTMLISRK